MLDKSKNLLLQFLFYLESIENFPLVLPSEPVASSAPSTQVNACCPQRFDGYFRATSDVLIPIDAPGTLA